MNTPITSEQRKVLDSLVCERLSMNPDNVGLIKKFVNKHNPNLAEIIRTDKVWQEDKSNVSAFYLVKTQSGIVLSCFALRCGEVFQNVDENLIETARQFQQNIIRYNDPDIDDEEMRRVVSKINDAFQQGWNMNIAGQYISKSERIESDKIKDTNKDNHHVAETFSALELAIICNNEANGVKEEWDKLGLPHGRGISIFWHFTVEIVRAIVGLVGCEYLYLFAADTDADGELVNYYKTEFHFQNPVKLGANKPTFDYECIFLCQRVEELFSNQTYFYENFNKDMTDAV